MLLDYVTVHEEEHSELKCSQTFVLLIYPDVFKTQTRFYGSTYLFTFETFTIIRIHAYPIIVLTVFLSSLLITSFVVS